MSRNILTGLVGAWCPSLGPSGYTLLDRSGRGNHGTLINMDAGDWLASGGGGIALKFESSSDYVSANAKISITNATFAVSLWFLRTAKQDFPRLIDLGDGTNTFQIVLDDGGGGNNLVNTKHTQWQTGISATAWFAHESNRWYNIVANVDSSASSVELFVDGIKQNGTASNNVGAGTSAQSVFFGIRRDFNTQTDFSGYLSDIGIYNRTLTHAEITQLYKLGRGGLGRLLTQRAQRRVFRTQQGNRRRRLICGAEC